MIKSGLVMKYFVLNPHKRTIYGKASREAILKYAEIINTKDPDLAIDLQSWIEEIAMEFSRKKYGRGNRYERSR